MRSTVLHVLALVAASQAALAAPTDGASDKAPQSFPLRRVRRDRNGDGDRDHAAGSTARGGSSVRCVGCAGRC